MLTILLLSTDHFTQLPSSLKRDVQMEMARKCIMRRDNGLLFTTRE